MIIVEKCIKKAGLLTRARTYRLELHEDGLFILCLGKATGDFTDVRLTTLEKVVAKKALNFFEQKYEKEHQTAVDELKLYGVRQFAQKKNCSMIPLANLKSYVTFNNEKGYLEINDPNCKLKLYPRTLQDYQQMEKLTAQIF